MNKHLNNFLDKAEGLPEETSNNNIKKEMTLREMAQKGGKASAEKRFEGKTKEEISEQMRKVRYSKKQLETIKKMGENALEGFKRIK